MWQLLALDIFVKLEGHFRHQFGIWEELCNGKDGQPFAYGWIKPNKALGWVRGAQASKRGAAAHETHPWFDFGLRLWLNFRTVVTASVDVRASWHQEQSFVIKQAARPTKVASAGLVKATR